ncbi:protein RADIALIS-like 3 [Arachis stenosperma]|uniref:protein RADIALIS-like 3 n=1 Tax=Arachis stenosperma TaxID=217475 RepID=UPI0025AB7B7F|nr:protein RADIALIS-like 3 [Arachis stenosperma]
MGEIEIDAPAKGLRCRWTWKENKLFELALAVVDENHPERWEAVAAMIGGEKSAGEVQEHYVILLEDLELIESGKFDHKVEEESHQPYVLVDHVKSLCLSHNDTAAMKPKLKGRNIGKVDE